METLKQFWRWLTTSRYTRWLEEENARLWELLETQRAAEPKAAERRTEEATKEVPRHPIRSWSRMRRQLEQGAMDAQSRLEMARQQRVAAHMRSISEE